MNPYVTNCLCFPSDCLWHVMIVKKYLWKAFKLHIRCNGQISSSGPLATEHSGREPCADAGKRSSHQFLGCWFFLSNLLTSPIHNIFTGYFFKICIGRVLKTTKGLLIMDNGPRCSVRCLQNSWQQCLGIIGLSFLCFFPANLRGIAEGLGDSLGVTVWWHVFFPQFVLKMWNKWVKNDTLNLLWWQTQYVSCTSLREKVCFIF